MPNPERINIKDLTLEEPPKKRELPFDVERDITEEDWDKLCRFLEEISVDDPARRSSFAYVAMNTKLLYPNKPAEYFEGLAEKIKSSAEQNRPDSYQNFSLIAAALKVLSPEKFSEFHIDNNDWQGMKEVLESYKNGDHWDNFAWHAMKMKIIFPNKTSELFLDENAWFHMEETLFRHRNNNDRALFAMEMRLLFPEKVLDFRIDKQMWDEMGKALTQSRIENEYYDFSTLAVTMKLLAAEEIKITDQGLEVIMQKEKSEFKEETPPMPQTRKF